MNSPKSVIMRLENPAPLTEDEAMNILTAALIERIQRLEKKADV